MKRNFSIFFIFLISLCLHGCLNYTQITTIKTDNSGKMYIHYWMEMDPELDSLLIKKIGNFNKDSLNKIFNKNFTLLNYITVYNDYKDSSLHAQIEFEFTNFDSLNQLQFFKHSELSVKEGPNETKIFSQFIQPITTSMGFSSESFEINYIYYLPGEIIKHNADTKFRNKLTWNFTMDDIGRGKTISANYIPFKLKETPIWIYYLASFVIIIVLVFLFKKSRK